MERVRLKARALRRGHQPRQDVAFDRSPGFEIVRALKPKTVEREAPSRRDKLQLALEVGRNGRIGDRLLDGPPPPQQAHVAGRRAGDVSRGAGAEESEGEKRGS